MKLELSSSKVAKTQFLEVNGAVVATVAAPVNETAAEKRAKFINGFERMARGSLPEELKNMRAMHAELIQLEAAASAPASKHRSAAIEKAGKRLFDVLGKDVFDSPTVAASWAAGLPFTEATGKDRDRQNESTLAAQKSHELRAKFWTEAGALARRVSRLNKNDTDRQIDEVIAAAW